MKIPPLFLVAVAVTAAAAMVGARRSAGAGATVPPDAVAWHGASELYRNLALYFGKRALACEARYWEAVKHG